MGRSDSLAPATEAALSLLRERKAHSCREAALRTGASERVVQRHVKELGIEIAPSAKPVDDPDRILISQLRHEVKILTRENKDFADALSERETFLERVAETVKRPVKSPSFKTKEQKKSLPERAVVVPVFDVQYGQHVIPEDTPFGRGEYSTQIFDRRLSRWYDGVTGSLRDYATSHRITEIIIPFGGDNVEGHGIFPGQEWQLQIDPFKQTWEFATKFGGDVENEIEGAIPRLIRFIKEEIGTDVRIRIYAVPGNHGKPQGRKAGALHATHSFDWLTMMMLRDKLRKQPVEEFAIEPAGALYFESAGSIFLMIHGDEIRGWGGIPFYGLARYDARAMRAGHILHDYLLLGDKHIPAEIEQGGGGETLMAGAWVGENNLSRQLGAATRPQQRMYYLAPKWGITGSERIYFQAVEESRQPAHIHGAVVE